MDDPSQLPLPLYLAAMLIATRLEKLMLQAPSEVVIKAISERPELFHYRALRNGKLLMWDIRMDAVLPEIDEVAPELSAAAREAGLDQRPPFHAFEEEGTVPYEVWKERKARIKEPIIDTTDPNSEPIYGGSSPDIDFVDTDTALDLLNEALEMSDGPEKETAVQRAKYLLKQASKSSD